MRRTKTISATLKASLQSLHTVEPLEFYFITYRDSEKCKLLSSQATIPCPAVVGTEVGVTITVQMRGELRIAEPGEHEAQVAAYYKKRGDRALGLDDSALCLLKFTPNWLRYKDYTQITTAALLRRIDFRLSVYNCGGVSQPSQISPVMVLLNRVFAIVKA